MKRLKGLVARLTVVACSMIMLVSMTAGTAYATPAVPATNTVYGTVGAGAPSAEPNLTWAGSNITLNLSIDTNGTGAKQYWLFGNGGGICSITGAVITISGAGQCAVSGRVFSGGGYTASTDEMEIFISKGNQATLLTEVDPAGGSEEWSDSGSGVYNEIFNLQATGGTTAGTIEFTYQSGPCTMPSSTTVKITSLRNSVSNCVVRGTMDGNDNYADVHDDVTITVSNTQATLLTEVDPVGGLAVWSDSGSGVYNQIFNLQATGGTTSGTITFTKVGLGNCIVDDGADTVTITTLSDPAVDCVVRGTMDGDDNYADVHDDVTITVGKATQATLLTEVDPAGGSQLWSDSGSGVTNQVFNLRANGGSSAGSITYSVQSGDCSVDNVTDTVTVGPLSNPAVTCVVRGTLAGGNSYDDVHDDVTITVGKATQATLLTEVDPAGGSEVWSDSGSGVTNQVFNLRANGGSSSGSIAFTKIGGDCSVDDVADTVTITTLSDPAVDCVVRGTMAGGNSYDDVADDVTINMALLPTTSASPTVRRSGRNATVLSQGTWNANGGTLSAASYQWYQCTNSKSAVAAASAPNVSADCVLIAGATTSTWRISGVNRRHLRVLVTRSNEAGSAYAWSATFRR